MGCDLYLSIEVKIAGVWHHYGHPCVGREPRLFEKLAGVRGDLNNAIVLPRGLPRDMADTTHHIFADMAGDAHHATWLTQDEIHAVAEWGAVHLAPVPGAANAEWTWEDYLHTLLYSHSFTSLRRRGAPFPDDLDDLRFVLWFD